MNIPLLSDDATTYVVLIASALWALVFSVIMSLQEAKEKRFLVVDGKLSVGQLLYNLGVGTLISFLVFCALGFLAILGQEESCDDECLPIMVGMADVIIRLHLIVLGIAVVVLLRYILVGIWKLVSKVAGAATRPVKRAYGAIRPRVPTRW